MKGTKAKDQNRANFFDTGKWSKGLTSSQSCDFVRIHSRLKLIPMSVQAHTKTASLTKVTKEAGQDGGVTPGASCRRRCLLASEPGPIWEGHQPWAVKWFLLLLVLFSLAAAVTASRVSEQRLGLLKLIVILKRLQGALLFFLGQTATMLFQWIKFCNLGNFSFQ